MTFENIILNNIKSAKTKELKVDLSIEYFKIVFDNISSNKIYILDVNEIIEIIDYVGKEFNDKSCSLLNKTEVLEICLLIKLIRNEYNNEAYSNDFIAAEEILSYRLLNIFKGIKNNNYNVCLKDSFNEISKAFKSVINSNSLNIKTTPFTLKLNNKLDSNNKIKSKSFSFRSDNPWCDYNLRPEDDGYEGSISEALDNMYGK